MRTDVPETPEFWSRLEIELREHAPRRRHRRRTFGVPVTAMRTLRTFTRHAVHTTVAAGLAVTMVMSTTKPAGDTAQVTIASTPDIPAYVAQYGGMPPDAETTVARARYNGYEVAVRRIFTPDPSQDGQILDEVRPGHLPPSRARGPILFVIGYTVGQGDRTAN